MSDVNDAENGAPLQVDLFGAPVDVPKPAPRTPETEPAPVKRERPARTASLQAAAWSPELLALGAALPANVRLGTSSWSYPGWSGLVWQDEASEQTLSKKGLPIYSQHPLFRTVSIDRGFYRPLSTSDYARYAAQVPPDFRFMVKAPSLITDALVRSEDGRGKQANPVFLNPELAVQEFVAPALEGLGARLSALVFQLSAALAPARPTAPDHCAARRHAERPARCDAACARRRDRRGGA